MRQIIRGLYCEMIRISEHAKCHPMQDRAGAPRKRSAFSPEWFERLLVALSRLFGELICQRSLKFVIFQTARLVPLQEGALPDHYETC
jgi:hypothetical protein